MTARIGRLTSSLRARARRLVPGRSGPEHLSAIAGHALTEVVLVVRRGGVALAEEIVAANPSVHVQLLTADPLTARQRAKLPAAVFTAHCPDPAARLRRLAARPQPQLIIERGLEQTGDRVDTFRALFGLVAARGLYVIDSAPSPGARPEVRHEAHRMEQELADLLRLAKTTSGEHTHDVELGRSLGSVEAVPGGWVISKRVAHQWMLRDRHATRILQARYGDAWGEEVASKPTATTVSRARAFTHGEGLRTLKPELTVPTRTLRRYRDVTCYSRKRVRLGDYWLPDTFRNPRMRSLSHRVLHSTGPVMARVAGEPEQPARTLDGPFFYLDSEYYSHFGHVLTDVVANTWGWQPIKAQVPEIRPLLSLPHDQPAMPDFQARIFEALGIEPDSAEYIRPGAPVHVSELYGCTPDWAMPRFCAAELADVWERIGTSCTSALTGTPELIFISRRPRDIRTCLNTGEVEAFFVRLGFTIVLPEDLTFGDQIATFAHARVIAGFAGSGMFGTMFAPQATVLVLTGDSYTALNEYLIKSLVGGDIHYFWSPALVRHPTGGWTWEAFRSNFVFDLDRFGPEIAEVISGGS